MLLLCVVVFHVLDVCQRNSIGKIFLISISITQYSIFDTQYSFSSLSTASERTDKDFFMLQAAFDFRRSCCLLRSLLWTWTFFNLVETLSNCWDTHRIFYFHFILHRVRALALAANCWGESSQSTNIWNECRDWTSMSSEWNDDNMVQKKDKHLANKTYFMMHEHQSCLLYVTHIHHM